MNPDQRSPINAEIRNSGRFLLQNDFQRSHENLKSSMTGKIFKYFFSICGVRKSFLVRHQREKLHLPERLR